MEEKLQQLTLDIQNPLSIWVYNRERYFTQLCVVTVPRDKVLEYLFEVLDIQARLCTAEETSGFFENTPGTFVDGDQVFIRIL